LKRILNSVGWCYFHGGLFTASLREEWSYQHPSAVVYMSSDKEYLYLSSFDGAITAISVENGRIAWQNNLHGLAPYPARVSGDKVLVANQNGIVRVLDRRNGQVLWQERINDEVLGSPFSIRGQFWVALNRKTKGMQLQKLETLKSSLHSEVATRR